MRLRETYDDQIQEATTVVNLVVRLAELLPSIGYRVYVTAGGVTQMRELHASTNFMTQEPGRIAHFGVGRTTVIDEVRAEWVSGEVTKLTDVAVDQHISISSP